MKIFGHNKPIIPFEVEQERWMVYKNITLKPDKKYVGYFKKGDILELTRQRRLWKEDQLGTLTNTGVLYFHPSAKFPRYKLKDSDYTRCIKVNRADFIVVGSIYPQGERYVIFEDVNNLYIIQGRFQGIGNLIPEFEKIGLKVKLLYNGYACRYNEDQQIIFYPPTNIPLILDKTLDKKVNKIMPSLDLQTANQIKALLNSSDQNNMELGLKTLASLNVQETPYAVKALLSLNTNWTKTSARNHVGVSTMLKNINLNPSYIKGGGFLNKVNYINKGEYTEADKLLGRQIMAEKAENIAKQNIAFVKQILGLEGAGFNIDLNIDINENI